MDPFGTSSIIDGATAMSQARLRSAFSVRTLRKALDIEGQLALKLLQSVVPAQGSSVSSPFPPGTGEAVDFTA